MENLVSILLSNGTGLLTGLCRRADFDYFDSIKDYSEVHELEVTFSLNERNLGTYKLSPMGYMGKNDNGQLFYLETPELESKGHRISITVSWEDGFYPTFKALLDSR